ncbi:ankyrin repeat family A protein 2 [Echinococcus multilocularis]|uniref:Ankyrin repeat family A protein 2 n=1 Tax=Echinococcus multilocularis TaxID=6211 RepID=A0A087W0U8_ECHMU|nr:ankyrin repeat family A protein 2 [Echinococcus multilocularis]
MPGRVVVPTPSFLPRKGPTRFNNTSSSAPNKVTTVLTNLQRRNVQTLKVDSQVSLSIFQMAAQGELLQLQAKLDTPGVNIDERDDKGFSPLLWACANGQKAAVELLLFRGANAHVRGMNGESALLLAACRGHYDVVQYLLRAGLPVDAVDELDNTALMFAAFYNHVAIVSLLLDWGADVTAINGEGWDALQIAVRRGARSSQRIIEKHLVSLLIPDGHQDHSDTLTPRPP